MLVVAQHHNEHNVPRTSLPFAGVDAAPDEAWMPVLADFGRLDIDAANARMVGEYFGRLDTTAALPGLEAIVARWRPDVTSDRPGDGPASAGRGGRGGPGGGRGDPRRGVTAAAGVGSGAPVATVRPDGRQRHAHLGDAREGPRPAPP